jgi:hypothetical protein
VGKSFDRFVAKAAAGEGWRVWDRKMRRWWGERYRHYPEQLLAELNGGKNPDRLARLIKQMAGERV